MTIRLTSVEAFEKVLEKLKQNVLYDEDVNTTFFKYSVDSIKEGIAANDDEWYLDVDFINVAWSNKPISMVISYQVRSEILTDEEYLTGE